ncbi:MAG: DUF1624 domain-containing protein [Bacteroidetes bacterium]|nr:DUF1624 domain-containing protein [Bacteroidota bacterium]
MRERDHTIDILRGMAVFTMIAANMAAHSLLEPHPFLFRLYGSFAAPCFIFLAGMMVSYTAHYRGHKPVYYVWRGLMVIAVAALIDVFCWGVVPFTTFDVLYILGFSMPFTDLFLKLKKPLQIIFIAILFSLTPIMQHIYGYRPVLTEPMVKDFTNGLSQVPVLQQFLVDGWFPVFPWFGVAFLGAFAGQWRIEHEPERINRYFILAGVLLTVTGIAGWYIMAPVLYTREGYSELFYPPTLPYLATMLGIIMLALGALYRIRNVKGMQFFAVYGRSSLLMYIVHTVLIVYVFNLFFPAYNLTGFLALYLCHAFILWGISAGVQFLKKGRELPFLLSFLLGG